MQQQEQQQQRQQLQQQQQQQKSGRSPSPAGGDAMSSSSSSSRTTHDRRLERAAGRRGKNRADGSPSGAHRRPERTIPRRPTARASCRPERQEQGATRAQYGPLGSAVPLEKYACFLVQRLEFLGRWHRCLKSCAGWRGVCVRVLYQFNTLYVHRRAASTRARFLDAHPPALSSVSLVT